MAIDFRIKYNTVGKHPLSDLDMFSAVFTVVDENNNIISQKSFGPEFSKAALKDEMNVEIARLRATEDGRYDAGEDIYVKTNYGTVLTQVFQDGTRKELTLSGEDPAIVAARLTRGVSSAPQPVVSFSRVTAASGGGNGFAVSSFDDTSVEISVPNSGLFDIYIGNTYATSASRPSGIYKLAITSIKNFTTSNPATINFVYPATGVDSGGVYTSSITVSSAESTTAPTVTKITDVNGGGNGFALINFSNSEVKFSVPNTGSFDVYISGNYVATSSQPDGVYERFLSQIKAFDEISPATIGFVYPATGINPGEDSSGVYTSSFSVSWLESVSSSAVSSSSTEDSLQIVLDNQRNEELILDSVGNSLSIEITNEEPSEGFPDGNLSGGTSGTAISLTNTPVYHIHQDDDFLTAWQNIATAMTELATISTTLKGYTESIKNDISVFKALGTNSNQGISTKEVFVNTACRGGGLQPAIVIEALQDAGIWEDVLKELGDPLHMPSGERQSQKDAKNA